MGTFIQSLINGLSIGSSYALVAVGFTLIFGVLRVVYLTHAAVLAVGAYVGFFVLHYTGSVFITLLAGMIASGFVGMIVEIVAIRTTRGQNHLIPMVTSISAAVLIEETLRMTVEGGQPISYPRAFTSDIIRLHIGTAAPYFTVGQILVFVMTIVLVLALTYIVQRTWLGRSIRAVADSETTASLLGIRVNQTSSLTVGLASVLAGAGGVLLALTITAIDPRFADPLQFKSIAIVLFVGMGSIPGAVVGGYLLGFVESFAVGYLESSYRDLFAYLMMIGILMIRPQGLMGRQAAKRV